MNQWAESIKKFFGEIEIGIIRGNRFDKHCDITIGMLHTISMRKEYTRESFSDFSLCFIDECHHLSSEVFSEALFKCRTKYNFGLSATINRKDGLEFVFSYHLGDVIFSDKFMNNSKQETSIKKIDYVGESSVAKSLFNGKPKISTMITNISQDPERNKMIVRELLSLDDTRRVLVLSDRLSQIKILHEMLGDELSGIFVGKTDKESKQISKTKKILLATYNIASEGFDHPVLNTLLFATPRTNIIQSIGRIYRKIHDVKPLIIDIVDGFSIFPYQFRKRKIIYNQQLNKPNKEDECLFD
jgi:superfamily II DNA or RNA helicase